jgi:hypothetical protein
VAFSAFLARSAQRNALIYKAVIADFGGLADNDSRTVVDKEPLANLRSGMNLKTGNKPCKLAYYPCQGVKFSDIKLMRNTIKEYRMKPRIG